MQNATLGKMDQVSRDALNKRAEDSVATNVIPAYTRLVAYIETLHPKALRNDGAWSLPDGDKYYQRQVEAMTTTTTLKAGYSQTTMKAVHRF